VKICPVAAELLHADGRTEMAKPTVAFRDFTNAPKNVSQNYRPTAVQRVSRIMKKTPAHPRTCMEIITVWSY
jgi:hypothetical protein